MLKSLFTSEVKVNNTLDDNILGSNLITNTTEKLFRKSFFCFILGFAKKHLTFFDEPTQGFIQIITG